MVRTAALFLGPENEKLVSLRGNIHICESSKLPLTLGMTGCSDWKYRWSSAIRMYASRWSWSRRAHLRMKAPLKIDPPRLTRGVPIAPNCRPRACASRRREVGRYDRPSRSALMAPQPHKPLWKIDDDCFLPRFQRMGEI